MDPSLATTSSSAPVGFLLFGPQESSRRRQGRNADGLREMFRRAPSPNFLTASGSSLRPCGEAGTTWQVRTVSRGTREERIRPGTPSRAPGLLLDYVGGRFVPTSVRRRSSRRSEYGKLWVVAGSSRKERGLTSFRFRCASS